MYIEDGDHLEAWGDIEAGEGAVVDACPHSRLAGELDHGHGNQNGESYV